MSKMRQWTLFTALAALAIFAAGWSLLISPARSHAKDLRAQAAQQLSANDSTRSQVQMLRAQAKDLPAQQAKLAAIAIEIPDNPALPTLIRSLTDAANAAGVDLVSLAPSTPAPVQAAGSTTRLGTTATPAAPSLVQIPVSIQVSGSFFNLEQFQSQLEHLKRAVMVDGLSVTPGSKSTTGPAAGAHGELNATITARVFMQVDSGSAGSGN